MGMMDEGGNISIMGVIMVFIAATLLATLGQLHLLEQRMVDGDIGNDRLRAMAEGAAQEQFERVRQNTGLLGDIIKEHRDMMPLGQPWENEKGRCQVYIGEQNNQVIIWAVAEKDTYKAQVSYVLSLGETNDRFVLKGMY